jgi:hypothetical protein
MLRTALTDQSVYSPRSRPSHFNYIGIEVLNDLHEINTSAQLEDYSCLFPSTTEIDIGITTHNLLRIIRGAQVRTYG